MKSEIYSLYEDLNKLLGDICELLSEEVKNNGISLKNRNVANQLIERSKKQLQNISRIASSTTENDSGSYMDMNKTSEYIDPDKKLHDENPEIYSDVDMSIYVENDQIICPYELTPAQEIPYVTKYGYLDRKEKFLFIEHQKRIFATISKPWMIIYSSDKDQKPNETLDLRTYQVKVNENQKDSKKKDEKSFELVNVKKTKSYHFTASTPKDMLQWVAEIERVNPSYQIDQVVSEKPMESGDYENIYEKFITDEHHKPNVNSKVLKPRPLPNLPPRISKNHYVIERPIPSIPPANKEKYSEKTPELKETSLADNSWSFPDDDLDDIYDELLTDFQPQTQPAKHMFESSSIQNTSYHENEEEDVEYDVIQTDMIQTQPNNNKEQSITKEISLVVATGAEGMFSVKPLITVNSAIETTDENDPELIYDLIQTDTQIKSEDNKEPQREEVLKGKERPTKIKPEISKVKPPLMPKAFQLTGKDTRPNSKVSTLVQQLTKKSKT